MIVGSSFTLFTCSQTAKVYHTIFKSSPLVDCSGQPLVGSKGSKTFISPTLQIELFSQPSLPANQLSDLLDSPKQNSPQVTNFSCSTQREKDKFLSKFAYFKTKLAEYLLLLLPPNKQSRMECMKKANEIEN